MSQATPPRSRRGTGTILGALGVALTLAMAGCGPAPSSPSPAPTASAGADEAREEQKARANASMLTPEEMPGGPWEAGGPVSSDAFGAVVCGVDTEPVEPLSVALSRRVRTTDDLELRQTSRPIGEQEATAVVDALATAVPTCGTDTRIVNGREITFEIKPLSSPPGVVAFTETSVGGAFEGMTGAQAYFVRDGCLVAFSAVGVEPSQAADLMDGLVRAVLEKR